MHLFLLESTSQSFPVIKNGGKQPEQTLTRSLPIPTPPAACINETGRPKFIYRLSGQVLRRYRRSCYLTSLAILPRDIC